MKAPLDIVILEGLLVILGLFLVCAGHPIVGGIGLGVASYSIAHFGR